MRTILSLQGALFTKQSKQKAMQIAIKFGVRMHFRRWHCVAARPIVRPGCRRTMATVTVTVAVTLHHESNRLKVTDWNNGSRWTLVPFRAAVTLLPLVVAVTSLHSRGQGEGLSPDSSPFIRQLRSTSSGWSFFGSTFYSFQFRRTVARKTTTTHINVKNKQGVENTGCIFTTVSVCLHRLCNWDAFRFGCALT